VLLFVVVVVVVGGVVVDFVVWLVGRCCDVVML